MIDYKEHHLPNGLHLIVHEDHSSPVVCLNLLYKVGSRNEKPDKTGFAHLFEHLMFGGSQNITNFDSPLQQVGGDNNAFTNTDITNYYITVPSSNVETAFWLESDRMLGLSFDPKVLEVQQKVVIEEFKQRYLNQPYGDIWLKLRPLAYQKHPYQWPTIGKEISHIEDATMDDVKSFFNAHYHPGNAVLVLAGDISEKKALALTEKWFGPIPSRQQAPENIPVEPKQKQPRHLELRGNVPASAIHKVYHMPKRFGKGYHEVDLLADLLGVGKSSILHHNLVKENALFSSIGAYVTGSVDPGLFVVSGKLNDNISIEKADQAIQELITPLKSNIDDRILQKVKNQGESTAIFSEVELLNRAMGLAYATFLGNTDLVNTEIDLIREVTQEGIASKAEEVLDENNCTTLYYLKNEA